MKKIISLLLLTCTLALCLTSCSSLPKALKGDTLESTSDFLETNPDDAEIKKIIDEVSVLADVAFKSSSVGYSESDKTIYIIYYSGFSKYGAPGVNYSDVIPSVEGIAYEISNKVNFGKYNFGIVTVGSGSNILFIIKDGKLVKDNTEW